MANGDTTAKTHAKVTMVLTASELKKVETLRRHLHKESNSVTVGSALNIAEAVVSKLENGCELYEKHKDGTWSRLELAEAAA